MQIGFVGLGKMGKNIVLNMLRNGYEVVAFNRSPAPLQEVAAAGATAATSVEDVVKRLNGRKVVWLMYPSGEVTENAVRTMASLLKKGDIIINGANDNYKEAAKYQALLSKKGITILDAGCSGGPSGALNGMSIMVGRRQGGLRPRRAAIQGPQREGGPALLRPGRRWSLRQDGPQRGRIRDDAVDSGGLRPHGQRALQEDGPREASPSSGTTAQW